MHGGLFGGRIYGLQYPQDTYRRAQYEGLDEQLKRCMLCGKCLLVCPRGVNTRSLIINMRRLLANVQPNTFVRKGAEQ